MGYSTNKDHSGIRALVVDDVATNRFLLKSILKTAGYETAECKDGEECIKYCADKGLPDVILLDVMMPGISGIETCEILRRHHSKVELPIIMVTTFSEAEGITQGLAAGANDYVTKPIDRSVLIARLESHLATSRAQKEIDAQKAEVIRAFEIQRAMGNVLPEAIAIENSSNEILYMNQPFESMCGSASPKTIEEAFSKLAEGYFSSQYVELKKEITSDPRTCIERELEREGAKKQCLRVLTRPIELHDDSTLRLWLVLDLTRTRELEDAVSQRVKLETMSLFAAGVAHNFNNVLSSILGASELLKKMTDSNPRAERCVGVIQKSINTGIGLTKRLSAMVKREIAGIGGLTQDINEAITTAVEVQSLQAGERIEFIVKIDNGVPPVAIAEQNFLDILTNLLTNAVDSIAEAGKVTVQLTWDRELSTVCLRVKDNGCGMNEASRQRAFEPFFSTKNMDTRNGVSYEGNGLGMWTVYNLTRLCGGDVQLTSELGVGTEVSVTLPVVSES